MSEAEYLIRASLSSSLGGSSLSEPGFFVVALSHTGIEAGCYVAKVSLHELHGSTVLQSHLGTCAHPGAVLAENVTRP
jgi:hypothetical protein